MNLSSTLAKLTKSHTFRVAALLIMVLGTLCSASSYVPTASAVANQSSKFKVQSSEFKVQGSKSDGRVYTETVKTLASEFVDFYDEYGGVLQFGYPVTDARIENGYLVQWTERQRLEFHPEISDPKYEVLLGLLGRELTEGLEGPRFQRQVSGVGGRGLEVGGQALEPGTWHLAGNSQRAVGTEGVFVPETGQNVAEPFLSYWEENGGLPIYGYPISSAYTDESGLLMQWFERARFEYHPEYPEHDVLLGHLGIESLKALDASNYELEVFGNAAPESKLRIELAQGGKSEDPHFLDNVREAGEELGPGLVRLDNIFNFYGIVKRDGEGNISYSWERFDAALDGVRAMGREPLICLSYMPETMSTTGESRVTPPASYDEWGALVRATVAHVNGERKLGVKYWEVWNEPDQWGFWQGSYPDYLKLYDVTVEAALSADASVRLGGPGVSHFSGEHLEEFLAHEALRNADCGLRIADCGRVDFLSWHEYGQEPSALGEHIREARLVLEEYPQFKPELFVTEFNVLQGGKGDTSANGATDRVEGAIALLASIESMQRERLDRAFLFELKDGRGPEAFWGRWGILTNDGQAKPVYHVYKAYQNRPSGMLPVSLRKGEADGLLGMMAYGSAGNARLFLWYRGAERARVKVSLPGSFGEANFELTLFDETHNNPAVSGDSTLRGWMRRNAGDLVLELKGESLVVLETVR